MTQKELKRLVKVGAAKDITDSSSRAAIQEDYRQVGYSSGVYGYNGMLLWRQRTAVCRLCKNFGYLHFRLKLQASVWFACLFLLSTINTEI